MTRVIDQALGEDWALYRGDCCEVLEGLPDGSVGLSMHSPPFAQLYTYSASQRDMGNCGTYEAFFEHYRFAARELLRVTAPGRRACVHVQQIAMTKVMQGVIAWRDFRAEVVRLYCEQGWIYHGEIVIDKDPQAQAIRTKSKTLLFVQLHKDSSWSIPAMADYILLFRAPGENAVPVVPDVSNEEWIRWARPVWYGIRETDTLQAAAARAERDEKHIAPLQLETVERCVRLWSNRGETVLDPMAGIGTVPYVALRHGRRGVGIELKAEYFAQACRNLSGARSQLSLLEVPGG
jgi:DNA modification methylase